MDSNQKKKLEEKTHIGRTIRFKDKNGGTSIIWGIVRDEVYIIIGDYKHVIQRIEHPRQGKWQNGYWDKCKFGYRTGYFTFDKSGKKLMWGQFAQFLTEHEYRTLIGKTIAKGWPIFIKD